MNTSTQNSKMENILRELVPGSGQYVILPKGVKILNRILGIISIFQTGMGFEQVYLPKILPVETLRKAGIIGKWDPYLLSVNPYSETKGVTEEYLMDPLQCLACYQALEGERLDVSQKPIKWFDCSGPTYRNENLERIEAGVRQREFHRAEFVYIGHPNQVEQISGFCLYGLKEICRCLSLNSRIVEGDSCYQEGGDIKDVEVYIRDEDRWLEVGGASVLFDIVTSKFDIKSTHEDILWSGCMGIGLDRLLYAVVQNE